ncbi:hypothetical protein pZL12.35c [Streptomyces phage ZL12]|uniref:Recombination endonuclease VII n=1 Tax=Streptomyces phage ZL12 TaxID=2570911 RepID=D0UWE0_9CAUD|nr:hypothetical protein QEH43_gp035 [Streptomyces phage ZL12]ACX71112.1 hypothetical protein pZL12.35c [Streptomyces phage ZL12]
MEPPRCGRPTASTRKPCRGFRLDPYEGCVTHLTPEERSAYETRRAEERAFWAPHWQKRAALIAAEPACWSWPVETDLADSEQGIAPDPLDLWQRGRCAICGTVEPLVTDHEHETGLVRGLLCRTCNTNEGMNGLPGTVYARYRERNPAQILGIRRRYWDPFRKEFARPAPPRQNGWDTTAGLM